MAGQGRGAANGRLSKEELFQRLAVREQEFALPTGGSIRIKGLDVDSGILAAARTDEEIMDRIKRICLLGIVDPKLTAEDLEALGSLSVNAVSDIAMAIMRLSGLVGETDDFFEPSPPPKASSSTARRRSTGSRLK